MTIRIATPFLALLLTLPGCGGSDAPTPTSPTPRVTVPARAEAIEALCGAFERAAEVVVTGDLRGVLARELRSLAVQLEDAAERVEAAGEQAVAAVARDQLPRIEAKAGHFEESTASAQEDFTEHQEFLERLRDEYPAGTCPP